MQKELNEQIKEHLKRYIDNNSNSVSGSNFKELLLNLELIQSRWEGHCQEYVNKIGKP